MSLDIKQVEKMKSILEAKQERILIQMNALNQEEKSLNAELVQIERRLNEVNYAKKRMVNEYTMVCSELLTPSLNPIFASRVTE